MRLDIILTYAGSTVDVETAANPQDAVRVLIKMLEDHGELRDGYAVRVETHSDDL